VRQGPWWKSIFPWAVGKFGVRPSTFAPMADQLDLSEVSAALRRIGWGRFWTQLALGGGVLVVCAVSNNISGYGRRANSNLGLGASGPGVSHHPVVFAGAPASLWQAWQVIRCGRRPGQSGSASRGETSA